eukprot:TRINITY_DN4593_c0_g1_i1.p1 TRINITY_DN4593_c0_g1~~TRINITY_DN4593_c0_g1_i1.p1  ORF type:complete len:292 (+),score=55.49 TRINITY_DN4593_c0_g1_i1:96-971(+)
MNRSKCVDNCGFFGNPNTLDRCSQCYSKFLKSIGAEAPPSQQARPVAEGKQSTLQCEEKLHGCTIQVRLGDMTCENVDCIVNAANGQMIHASGLAGAIVKKGGQIIQQQSYQYIRQHGDVDEGMCMHTSAGNLPCRYVIHSVGPMWRGGGMGEEMLLQMAVRNCFEEAEKLNARSISLPAISSGIFGFPKDRCARIMWDTALEYIRENHAKATCLREIRFTNFDDETVMFFLTYHQQLAQNRADQPEHKADEVPPAPFNPAAVAPAVPGLNSSMDQAQANPSSGAPSLGAD